MLTLIIAAALIAVITAICMLLICMLLISIDKKQKSIAMNIFMNRLSQAGSSNNLSFSSQEVFKDTAIGLDGLHRKLLVLTRFKTGEYFDLVININDAQSFSVKKIYGFINAGDLKSGKLEKHLHEIVLHIELYHYGSADIPFYNHIDNTVYEAAGLENKAKQWEIILTKLLKDRFKKDSFEHSIVYEPSQQLNFTKNENKKTTTPDRQG